MQCDYFDARVCRSCELMGQPYADQLAGLEARARHTLGARVPPEAWEPVVAGPESGYRNKAKLVVGGRKGQPTLGILDEVGQGVDLQRCGLYEPGLSGAIPVLAEVVAHAGLTPYDVPRGSGELKNLIVTHSPDDELMVRWVLRSEGQLPRVRQAVDALRERLPRVRVATVNLLPKHVALLEGEREVVLTEAETLPMRVGEVTLHLGPRSFFQTNTAVATQLYAAGRHWVSGLAPANAWDLYSGVGGFALSLDLPRVVGVEVAEAATRSARRSARELAGARRGTAEFVTADATAYALVNPVPELVVVNPPRRGIGQVLAERLETSAARWVLYSSCNVESLARDLDRMPSLRVTRARPFAMFPQTTHGEVLVLLERD